MIGSVFTLPDDPTRIRCCEETFPRERQQLLEAATGHDETDQAETEQHRHVHQRAEADGARRELPEQGRRAVLRGALLDDAVLTGASLDGVDLSAVQLKDTVVDAAQACLVAGAPGAVIR